MKSAYPLSLIIILIIISYSLSLAFVWIGLISRVNHRKFWNILLMFAFLVAGIIGLFLVVKINYKLEVPYSEMLLSYHVGFGIGMVLIGMVHLWWHIDYYLSLFVHEKSRESGHQLSIQNDMSGSDLRMSAFLLGSTSMIAQVVLLREFLSVFNGNELVIGLVLANWMVLTGIGAVLGKSGLSITKVSLVLLPALFILSLLPLLSAFLINYLKNKIFPIGAMIDIFQIFFTSLILLIPFCLVSGFLFTFISGQYSKIKKSNETGSIYSIESVGSITGGLLSGLVFIFILSSFESLLFLAVINGIILFLISKRKGLPGMAIASLILTIAATILFFFHPEKGIRKWVYPNQEIADSKDTPWGNIVITKRENMRSIYNNNILLYDSENFMTNEEGVHFAMVQHPRPSNILVVSGDLSGEIGEIKKYNPISIDCLEENRWLLALTQGSLTGQPSEGIRLYSGDPIRFIRNTIKSFGIVLLNLPAPSTLQGNRFYTVEFFSLVKDKLLNGGVLSFGLSSPVNYLNKESVVLTSTLYKTLKTVFQNVIIIPGEKNYFIASDEPLRYDITMALHERGIKNRYVNTDYFNDVLLKSRGEAILSALSREPEINRNLKPVLYQQETDYWLSHFKGKFWLMAILSGILSLYIFFSGNKASKTMFLTGLSATGLEMLLLIGLQTYFGTAYILTSFVFAGFMGGLAAGSWGGKHTNYLSPGKSLFINQLGLSVLAFATAFLLFTRGILSVSAAFSYTIYMALIVLIGALTGYQFTKVSIDQPDDYTRVSGRTYSYDLFGSATGALLVSLFLIPGLGIVTTAILLGILNLFYGIFVTLRRN